jgi:hypothetical protein
MFGDDIELITKLADDFGGSFEDDFDFPGDSQCNWPHFCHLDLAENGGWFL